MKRLLPPGAWFVAGIVIAGLLVPAAAYAVATQTQIVGTNGTAVAQVTSNHQLTTIETAPTTFFEASTQHYTVSGMSCIPLGQAPAGKALVVRNVEFITSEANLESETQLYNDTNCGNNGALFSHAFAIAPNDAVGMNNMPLTPGVAIAAPADGQTFMSVLVFTGVNGGEVKGDVIVEGYLVSTKVVPTSEQMAVNNCTGC